MKNLKPKGRAQVSQMINGNGNAAANQFIITHENCQVFQSYSTIIAQEFREGQIVLDTNALNYSKTTSRHLFIFLGIRRKDIEKGIKDGCIKVKNLN